MSQNPYESPQGSDNYVRPKVPPVMTWAKGILIVVATTAAGGLGGLAIGAALGAFVPGYYRLVFRSGNNPDFDPVAVGIGQGLTQGIASGVVIGLGVVAAIAWFKTKRVPR